jgi:hypothetical protein
MIRFALSLVLLLLVSSPVAAAICNPYKGCIPIQGENWPVYDYNGFKTTLTPSELEPDRGKYGNPLIVPTAPPVKIFEPPAPAVSSPEDEMTEFLAEDFAFNARLVSETESEPVPEPVGLVLLGLGLFAIARRRR